MLQSLTNREVLKLCWIPSGTTGGQFRDRVGREFKAPVFFLS